MLAAEPDTPLALATDTVAPVSDGAGVVGPVGVVGPPVVVATIDPRESPGTVDDVSSAMLPLSPSSSVIARRMKKPAITAITASTMLRVDPTGDPPSPTRGVRREPRSGSPSAGPSGASVMRCALLPVDGTGPPPSEWAS